MGEEVDNFLRYQADLVQLPCNHAKLGELSAGIKEHGLHPVHVLGSAGNGSVVARSYASIVGFHV